VPEVFPLFLPLAHETSKKIRQGKPRAVSPSSSFFADMYLEPPNRFQDCVLYKDDPFFFLSPLRQCLANRQGSARGHSTIPFFPIFFLSWETGPKNDYQRRRNDVPPSSPPPLSFPPPYLGIESAELTACHHGGDIIDVHSMEAYGFFSLFSLSRRQRRS